MLIGICIEVHRQLGHGFLEIVYKDAIEWELRQKGISYERERPFLLIPLGYPVGEVIVPRLQRKGLGEIATFYE